MSANVRVPAGLSSHVLRPQSLRMRQQIETEIECEQIEAEWQRSLETQNLAAKRWQELRATVLDFMKMVIALIRTTEALPDPNTAWRNGSEERMVEPCLPSVHSNSNT